MLASLLNKAKHKKTRSSEQPRTYQWRFLVAVPAWVVAGYFASQLILMVIFWALNVTGIRVSAILNTTVLETLVAAMMYSLTLAVVIGVPYLIFKRPTNLHALGLARLPSWTDIGLAPLSYIGYAILVGVAIQIIMSIIPSFPVDQAQEIGFRSLGMQYEYTLAFIMLVIVGPIAEETLFRGYLYGKLKKHVPIYVAMFATSILFALAHGQWNVAVDTFILSLIMCGLREVTGSIWAGILLHMLKNLVAFYGLFVLPLMGAG